MIAGSYAVKASFLPGLLSIFGGEIEENLVWYVAFGVFGRDALLATFYSVSFAKKSS